MLGYDGRHHLLSNYVNESFWCPHIVEIEAYAHFKNSRDPEPSPDTVGIPRLREQPPVLMLWVIIPYPIISYLIILILYGPILSYII